MDSSFTIGDKGSNSDADRGKIEQNKDGSLKVPDNVILTVSAATTYYNSFRSAAIARIRLWAAIEGLIAGNPPYDGELLDQAGLGHIANVHTSPWHPKY